MRIIVEKRVFVCLDKLNMMVAGTLRYTDTPGEIYIDVQDAFKFKNTLDLALDRAVASSR